MSSYSPNQRSRRPRSRRRPGKSEAGGPPQPTSGGTPNAGDNRGNARNGPRGRRPPRGPRNRVDNGYDPNAKDRTGQPPDNGNAREHRRSRQGGGRSSQRRPRIPTGNIPALKQIQLGTSIDPFERIRLETTSAEVTTRALDLITPIGRGQRCLIVAPPMAGKTTLLIKIANAITANHPDIRLFTLLVDERPEEVTHFRRSTAAEIHAASSDMSAAQHIRVAEECVNKALEHVLQGEDVMLLLDSITRLARAYNTMTESGGRTLSGGLDATTMLVPRQIFGSARKIEDGGSLTIVATALIDTGSRMDEVIFQEFKGTGNMELFLSRDLFTKRIFPCVDIEKSGTRKEEKLVPPEHLARTHLLRRHMTALKPHEAMTFLLELLSRYRSNEQLLSSLVAK